MITHVVKLTHRTEFNTTNTNLSIYSYHKLCWIYGVIPMLRYEIGHGPGRAECKSIMPDQTNQKIDNSTSFYTQRKRVQREDP